MLSTLMDRKGNHSTNYHHYALKEITHIMETLEIVDIWRLKNPDLVRYSGAKNDLVSQQLCNVFIADFEKAFDKVRLDFIYKCLDF